MRSARLKDGDVAEYDTGNNGVASYIRMTQDDSVLVATNLTGNEITVEVKPDAEFGSFSKILKKFQRGYRFEVGRWHVDDCPV